MTRVGCAAWARSCGVSPAGTALASPGGVLLVEWPLPWPRDVRDVPELVPVVDAAAAVGARVLLVAGDGPPGDPGDLHTVCWYRSRSADPLVAAGFEPVERRCRRSDVVVTALGLLAGDVAAAELRPPIDVVVCTHGRRDVCCGRDGTALYHALREADRPSGVRLWRSSHQGGHRFAPTALLLPSGTAWAYLDVALVQAVLRRDAPAGAVIDHYRGYVGFGDPQLQALDGRALGEFGWGWLAAPRVGRRLGPTRLELVAADGTRCDGVVADVAPYDLPPCGAAATDSDSLTRHFALEVMAFRLAG